MSEDKMTEEEIDEVVKMVGNLCLDAIRKDLDLNVLDLTKLAINDVEYDEQTGMIEIDYDYDYDS